MTAPLAPGHAPSVPCQTERERMLNSVFTTALEGGIGYWSQCTEYRWHVAGTDAVEALDFIAVIIETGDGDGTDQFVIDRTVISRGTRKFYEHMRRLSQEGTANRYQWQAAKDLHHGNWDEADYDSDTADLIVQFGLFGEARYA
jgi:hypothetical protein